MAYFTLMIEFECGVPILHEALETRGLRNPGRALFFSRYITPAGSPHWDCRPACARLRQKSAGHPR